MAIRDKDLFDDYDTLTPGIDTDPKQDSVQVDAEGFSVALAPEAGDANIIAHGDGGFSVVDFLDDLSNEVFGDPYGEEWEENLAEDMDLGTLRAISTEILQMIEEDDDSRADWRQRFEDGLEVIGLKDQLPDDESPFPGAALVTHPLIMEAAVQFQSRAMGELCPPPGPAKTIVLGEQTEERREQADRVADFMNYQATVEDPSYYPEKQQLLMYLPIYGSAFTKTYYNHLEDRCETDFVRADDLIVPYDAKSLESATRITHRMRLSGNELRKRIHQGQYSEIDLRETPDIESQEGNQDVIDDLDDRAPSGVAQYTDLHIVYEVHIEYDLPGHEELDEYGEETGVGLPYIITIERDTERILSIRRNYSPDDELKRKQMWFTKYDYLPGLGFYGMGLLHVIGPLNESATALLRIIIDAGAFASNQGGFMARTARGLDGGEYALQMGVYTPVDMEPGELQNSFYTPPFKGPDPALAAALGALTELGQRFASTTESMVGEGDNKGPVGTTLALIEQGSKIHSGIHQRLHKSLGDELQLRAAINGKYVPVEGYPYAVEGGDRNIYQADFDERVDVVPVSDPKIFSNTQRIAKAQAVLEMSMANPDLFDRREVVEQMMKAMQIPDYESLMISDEPPPALDPVSENTALLMGKPIQAKAFQLHDAHIAVHMAFLQHPQFGGNPQAQEMIAGPMMAHLAEHLAYKYREAFLKMGVPMPNMDLSAQGPEDFMEELPPELQNQIAAAAAKNLAGFMQATGIAAPPPQQQMSPSDAAAEVKIGLAEQKHQQDMKHAEEDHQQEMRHREEDHRLDESQGDRGFVGDEKRKDARDQAEHDRQAFKEMFGQNQDQKGPQ